MLLEFTSVKEVPIFINPEDISAIEEKKYTNIYLNNGIKLIVIESANEVSREVNGFLQNKMMEMLENYG
jgi:uncharacterized protein YlzI (FlbEa/FlbD family)